MASRNQSRRAARSLAFQVLYGQEFVASTSLEALSRAFAAHPLPDDLPVESQASEGRPVEMPAGFAWELVKGVWSHTAELDALIERFARNWRLERVGRVELTILRIAIYEMLYRPDVPPKVAMNEALELDKLFGEDKSRLFVNGILDAAAKALAAGSHFKDSPRP